MTLQPFHDIQFPMSLAFGAVGGPERNTQIVQLASGKEHRTSVWAGSRRRWDVGSAISSLDELHDLIAFFEACRGPLYGFRFRDVLDDRSCQPEQEVAATDQSIGTGDGSTAIFPLIKAYGEVTRRILKPVPGSVEIALDGVSLMAGFTADHDLGQVVFDTPPPTGAAVTAGFLFDCPARFEGDQIQASLEGFGAGRIAKVQIVELMG